MDSRAVHPRGRVPGELLALFAWIVVSVGGSIVSLWALVAYVRTSDVGSPEVGSPAAAATLQTCHQPELVIVLEDNSVSVSDLDPGDERLLAVRSLLERLTEEPCTADDLVSVVSFTDRQAITGPTMAAALGPIERAAGGATDIGAAVGQALLIADSYPEHRPVVIMLSDLEERSAVPLDDTLQRLEARDVELILVSIGDVEARPGTTQLALRNRSSIAADLVNAINRSRSQS